MDIDTIIYAIVAAILLIRLWSVLGRRDSDDVTRPNPFVAPPSPQKETADAPFNPTDDTGQPIPRLVEPFVLPPNSLAGGLEKIQTMDPTFDEKKFLQGARSAFSMIIENFAANHIESIERLLGEKVLAHFRAAVLERQKTGQTMESKIISITEAEITAVKIEESKAFLTVRFVSLQENILRDASSHVLGGTIGKTEEVTDLWTFVRDVKAADPNWILIETHG